MAWYAIYKWASPFRKRPFEVNWTAWYSEKLYNEWFDSLSEEDQQKIIAYREAKKEQREKANRAHMLALMNIMRALGGDRFLESVYMTSKLLR